MRIGIPNESASGQALVAMTPSGAAKLMALGYEVAVESGAGSAAGFPDGAYEGAGVAVTAAEEVQRCDIVVRLDAPDAGYVRGMAPGSMLVCRMNPAGNAGLLDALAQAKVTGLALDAVPRISRAQSLDVRSSMMNVAGYRAVIEAANVFGRVFGGQVTAAGSVPPARVYVIGVGVAGLAAIGVAQSMGASVSATDVRADVADQVESLGATFVEIPVKQESDDGYAKVLTDDQQDQVLKVYAEQAAKSDIVITTAQLPGRPSPLLLTHDAVAGMKPGSVIVDMGASPKGCNCEDTVPGMTVYSENGVAIVGYEDLASRMPQQASQMFGQNVVNLFKLVTPAKDGAYELDEEDEVVRGMMVARDGEIMWPPPAVKVSAAPRESGAAEGEAHRQAGAAEAEAKAEAEDGPAWRRWWWKAALGVLGVLLVATAPEDMLGHFFVFVLAVVVGFYVVTNVTHTLHTPLMSVTNAISGIIVVGAVLLIGSANPLVAALSFVAMVIASINVFGGFLVTHRMLSMFERSAEDE